MILLTGSNRSGSTWAGRTLSSHPLIRYIHEPLNKVVALEKFGQELPRWFLNIEDANELTFVGYFNQVIRPPLIDRAEKKQNQFYRAVRLLLERGVPRQFGKRPLLKDPIAIFSAGWLASRFEIDVIVLIRHPCAYVASLLKDPTHMHSFESIFLSQRSLMERFPAEEIDLIHQVVSLQIKNDLMEKRPVFQAAVFWRLIHCIILQYQERYDAWHFERYEDLARDPLKNFGDLCQKLNLPASGWPNVSEEIHRTSLVENKRDQITDLHVKQIDSRKATEDWRQKLTNEQILEIREVVEPVSSKFYTSEDW